MTRFNKAITATLVAATILGSTTAQADLKSPNGASTLYYAQIDCHASGLDHTDTKSNVKVKFVSDNGDPAGTATLSITDIEAETMKINPTINPLSSALGVFDYPRCGVFADAVYMSDTFEPFELKHIEISIGGDDAFWMDEVRVYRRDFANNRFKDNLVGHWGRDNGKGWCLSTDANDINGSFKERSTRSGCVTGFRFEVKDEKVFAVR